MSDTQQYSLVCVTARSFPLLTVYNKANKVMLQTRVPEAFFWTSVHDQVDGDYRPRYIALAYDKDHHPRADAKIKLWNAGRNWEARERQFEGVYTGEISHKLMKRLRGMLRDIEKARTTQYILRG